MPIQISRPGGQLSSIRPDGSRVPIHPSDVHGRFITARRVVFAILIAVYALAPLIRIGGHPAIHLDVAQRRFFLLGQTYNAQDFWMVILIALNLIFGLLAVTTWRGRLWCGWACPQTVFLESFFRPIERLFDGPRERRMKRETAPRNARFYVRAILKHAAYLTMAWLLSHVALALFLSVHDLLGVMVDGPAAHPVAFGWAVAVTGVLYFNFAWFREQFCVVLCPYGRLQSVMHDRDSIVIGYDAKRGEPRGPLLKAGIQGPPRGDCVDCGKCVTACPTAIDIRHGLQMECIACAQCVDACDEVMTKIHKPIGLIRYASSNELEGKPTRQVRPRTIVYSVLFTIVFTVLTASLLTRKSFEANLLRLPGLPYFVEGTEVRNSLQIHLINKSPDTARYTLTIDAAPTIRIAIASQAFELESLTQKQIPLFVWARANELHAGQKVQVRITDETHHTERLVEMPLLGPPGASK